MGMPGLSPFWEASFSTCPDKSKVQPVSASTAAALSSDIATTVKHFTRKEAARTGHHGQGVGFVGALPL